MKHFCDFLNREPLLKSELINKKSRIIFNIHPTVALYKLINIQMNFKVYMNQSAASRAEVRGVVCSVAVPLTPTRCCCDKSLTVLKRLRTNLNKKSVQRLNIMFCSEG